MLAASTPKNARSAARVFNRMQERIRAQLEARGRFLAAVSHDLRTPLTRMKLRIESFPDTSDKDKLKQDIGEMAAMLDATLAYLRDISGYCALARELAPVLMGKALWQTICQEGQELAPAEPLFMYQA